MVVALLFCGKVEPDKGQLLKDNDLCQALPGSAYAVQVFLYKTAGVSDACTLQAWVISQLTFKQKYWVNNWENLT